MIVNKSGNWTSQLSNKGLFTFSGDGTTTSKTISHGLGMTPSYWNVAPAEYNSGNSGIKYVLANATNLVVYFNTPPANGTNNISLTWRAEV
ncbi:hypothetical protein COI51_11490 [Bacillus toyonensis]|uniref:hypothetical protein n=1 Tax=Bacillus cereus group TaxID=86661 RepID=UPI000BEDD405|nr:MULTISPECIES: hypothetical protein [Bacillus cereus group]MBJ7930399.1 hypothetical protein [Bacillus cereus group sp. N31]PEG15049.1 hypothetical protein COO04_17195 [Bacillus toyonensis]PEK11325.1 hypothetical protein CN681_09460 [Bacillus toyonensis]PEM19240.1 hypothetical protein CN616_12135 [Bacillus toyonensis]PEM42953.1 hypothetical protein CN636_17785 [Bacillus toyonensis]